MGFHKTDEQAIDSFNQAIRVRLQGATLERVEVDSENDIVFLIFSNDERIKLEVGITGLTECPFLIMGLGETVSEINL